MTDLNKTIVKESLICNTCSLTYNCDDAGTCEHCELDICSDCCLTCDCGNISCLDCGYQCIACGYITCEECIVIAYGYFICSHCKCKDERNDN